MNVQSLKAFSGSENAYIAINHHRRVWKNIITRPAIAFVRIPHCDIDLCYVNLVILNRLLSDVFSAEWISFWKYYLCEIDVSINIIHDKKKPYCWNLIKYRKQSIIKSILYEMYLCCLWVFCRKARLIFFTEWYYKKKVFDYFMFLEFTIWKNVWLNRIVLLTKTNRKFVF